jgi:hypothetical protein
VVGVEERVAFLEGRVAEHSRVTEDVRQSIARLEQRVDRQFHWIVGIQMTTFVATIATILSAMLR